jgi:hypothetical protein
MALGITFAQHGQLQRLGDAHLVLERFVCIQPNSSPPGMSCWRQPELLIL